MKKTSKLHYGWILCFASCLMLTGGAGIIINSANQFLKPVTEAFGVSRGQFSFYISCISITSMIVSPFIGKIFTKFPPKRVTIFGGLLMVLCWLGLSVANNIYLFYVLGLLIGTGSSLTGMVCVSILMNNWFVERKGTAMGIALTGTGIGSMIFNPVASKLIVECGYQAAYRWLGLICILALLPYMLLFRYQPSEIGASPLGA
ncbi:MFS transporter, partial [Blautia hydrogenotrophica]